MSVPNVSLTGTLVDLSGNPVTGKVVATLCNFGTIPPRVSNTVDFCETQSTALAASDGTFTLSVWANTSIVPANTFYTIAIFNADASGTPSNTPTISAPYLLRTPGSFALSTLLPINSNPGAPLIVAAEPNYVLTNPTAAQTISGFPLNVSSLGSESAGAAVSGVIRLANTDTINWRNHNNNADLSLGFDSSDLLNLVGGLKVGTAGQLSVDTAGDLSTSGAIRTSDSLVNTGTTALGSTGQLEVDSFGNVSTSGSVTVGGTTLTKGANVTGPAAATDGSAVLFDGTPASCLKNSASSRCSRVQALRRAATPLSWVGMEAD